MNQQPSWEEFPRPSLAVDVVILTVTPEPSLADVVIRRTQFEAGTWDIPGAFVKEHETATEAVRRTLHAKAGVRDLEPQLLAVFDAPARDPRGWVVSLAYAAYVPHEMLSDALNAPGVALAAIPSPADHPVDITLPDEQRTLPFDHPAMVDAAVSSLQSRYDLGIQDAQARRPDPDKLMTHSPFTITDLRRLYETVHGQPIHRDAFARRFDPRLSDSTPLTPVGRLNTGGRPARAFELPEDPRR